jgi:hypothetical protein
MFCGTAGRQHGHDLLTQPVGEAFDCSLSDDGPASRDLQQHWQSPEPSPQTDATAGTASAAAARATMDADAIR